MVAVGRPGEPRHVFGIGLVPNVGANLLLVALLLSLLWRAALRRGLDADDAEVSLLTRRLTPGPPGYAVFLLSLLFPPVAVGGYLLVAITLIVPRRRGSAARPSASAA